MNREKLVIAILIIMTGLSVGLIGLALNNHNHLNFAHAANISLGIYRGTIQVTNNGTSTATAVSANMSLSTANNIDANYINSTVNNTAIVTQGNADIAYMPANPSGSSWIVWVPSINADESTLYSLYYGQLSDELEGKIRYFPGTTGMAVTDAAALEPGNNFQWRKAGYVETDNGTAKRLIDKQLSSGISEGANLAISKTESANVTFKIPEYDYFTSDTWTDVGTPKIYVSVPNSRIDYESERTASDERCYKEFVPSFIGNTWAIDFDWYVDQTNNGGIFAFGLVDNPANWNGFATDGLVMYIFTNETVGIAACNNGAKTYSSTIAISDATQYYVTFSRLSNTSARLGIYSDAARTTHVAGSPKSLTIPSGITGLKYIQASNMNDNGGAALEQIGWIDNVVTDISDAEVSLDNITSGERTITVNADGTNVWMVVDGTASANTTVVSIPDSSHDWTIATASAMPYMELCDMHVSGTQQGFWAWEYGATFPDQSGNGHTATPTFRTSSSNAYVSASLVTFNAIDFAELPSWSLVSTYDLVQTDDLPSTPSRIYSELNTTNLFLAPVFVALVEDTDYEPATFWFPVTILVIGLICIAINRMTDSIFMQAILEMFLVAVASFTIIPWWCMVVFAPYALAIALQANRQPGGV